MGKSVNWIRTDKRHGRTEKQTCQREKENADHAGGINNGVDGKKNMGV